MRTRIDSEKGPASRSRPVARPRGGRRVSLPAERSLRATVPSTAPGRFLHRQGQPEDVEHRNKAVKATRRLAVLYLVNNARADAGGETKLILAQSQAPPLAEYPLPYLGRKIAGEFGF
jgi:hypothetical protein